MGTQTGDGEGVKHALVQAGDGKLLSEAELQDECNLRELKVREAMHCTQVERQRNGLDGERTKERQEKGGDRKSGGQRSAGLGGGKKQRRTRRG